VSLQGISHYQMHGYKAKKLDVDDTSMVRIPYVFNQMICHLGNLPHSSTKVEHIHGDQERVIIGFNVFCNTAGPYVQQAPEHSDQFRRTIHLQRYINRTMITSKQKMSLQLLKTNKSLSKLLVLAKRQYIKNKYNLSRERLANEVPKHLPATVASLVAYFSSSEEGCNLLQDDVRVFLHHEIQQGQLKIMNGLVCSCNAISSPTAELDTA
jgi:hypothetical protein